MATINDEVSREPAAHPRPSAPGGAPSRVCCYTVDEGYLLPTLISASQLRRGLPPGLADVLVLCFGPVTDMTREAARFCAEEGLRFELVPLGELDGHPMICARFLLPRLLASTYSDILYLDGDTQVAGSLAPLVSFAVPGGQLLAAPDPMAVMVGTGAAPWPARRAYFRSIGIPDERQERYFNSGVMRFGRRDWEAVSRECLALCRRKGRAYEFRDQDALNLVLGDRAHLVSFRWNFPPFFLNFGAQARIGPRLYHFMSNPRPWQGAFAPWGRAWHEPYAALAAARPALGRSLKSMRPATRYRYVAQQRFKRLIEAHRWGTPAVAARIDAFEARAAI